MNDIDQHRRTLLQAGAVLAGLGIASAHAETAGHVHHGGKYSGLVKVAEECEASGRVCMAHCLESFKAGDTTLAACAASVEAMRPVCDALAQLAALDSRHVAAFAPVCRDVCQDCEKECRKHEKKHSVCKDCADACAKLITALKTVA
jgi:Cys-rich four helix bundle protein (predicted Tat secretion target)